MTQPPDSRARPRCLRCGATWIHRDDYAGLGTPHKYEAADRSPVNEPRPDVLDVERLIRAMVASDTNAAYLGFSRTRQDAERIAAEYARLTNGAADPEEESVWAHVIREAETHEPALLDAETLAEVNKALSVIGTAFFLERTLIRPVREQEASDQ